MQRPPAADVDLGRGNMRGVLRRIVGQPVERLAQLRGGRIAERRGTNKARVAVARKVLTLVYYGLRDGEIRCLARAEAA